MGASVGDAEDHITEDENEHGEQHRLDDRIVTHWGHIDVYEFREHGGSLVPFCLVALLPLACRFHHVFDCLLE